VINRQFFKHPQRNLKIPVNLLIIQGGRDVNKLTNMTAGIMLGTLTILSPNVALSQTASNLTNNWSVIGNNSTGTLTLNHNTTSNVITGTIYGQCIEGFYIPSVRRLVFIRRSSNDCTGVPYQFYEGWVSNNGKYLGGKFSVWNTPNGASTSGVDFNFSATR
jgi:hypothetical protein